jgi:hypothetical protein
MEKECIVELGEMFGWSQPLGHLRHQLPGGEGCEELRQVEGKRLYDDWIARLKSKYFVKIY